MTQQLIQSELEGIKDTQDPHLAYYLWTRRKDSKAKRVFLVAANQKGLKDSQLLTKLAIYYSKNDPQRALVFFFRALRASQSLDEIPESVFTHIMKIYYQSKNFEQAYIWALIAKAENTEAELSINFDLILKKGLTGGRKLINNEGALQAKADLYRQQLEEGVFNSKAQQ